MKHLEVLAQEPYASIWLAFWVLVLLALVTVLSGPKRVLLLATAILVGAFWDQVIEWCGLKWLQDEVMVTLCVLGVGWWALRGAVRRVVRWWGWWQVARMPWHRADGP